MALNPNIALGAQAPQQQANPLAMLMQVMQIQNLASQDKRLQSQFDHEAALRPYQIQKLQAEIAAIPELEAQRRAAAAKSQEDLAQSRRQTQGQNRLADLLNPQSSVYEPAPEGFAGSTRLILDPAEARKAAEDHLRSGSKEPYRSVTPPPGAYRSALVEADPKTAIAQMLREMSPNAQRPTVLPPGAGLLRPGEATPAYTQPFAPRAEPAPVVRVVPTADGSGANYQDMRAPGVNLAPAPAPKVPDDPRAKAAYNAGLKEIVNDEKAVSATADIERAFNRWKELNSQVETGRVTGMRPANLQPLFQEMVQLQNYLTVNNFKPGQGQISNFERQLVKGAGPNVLNDREANDRIVDVYNGAIQNIRNRAEFRQWYLDDKGKLLGSDKEWNDYIEKNPRYIKGKDGAVIPNTKRQEWTEYFKVGGGNNAPASAPAGRIPIPQRSILDQADEILGIGR